MSAAAASPAAGQHPQSPAPGVCPACGSFPLRPLVELASPVNMSVLVRSAEEARRLPLAPLRLAICDRCGLVSNSAFDAAAHDVTASYGETQGHSPRFLAYARELVAALAERYPLRGAEVLEIGCGRGDILAMLVREVGATGVGLDPGLRDEHARAAPPGIDLDRAYFAADRVDRPFALVLCRHTLEHVHDVRSFLGALCRGLTRAPGAGVVFEVPDALRILREGAFWDVSYEHCVYFTPGSLARAFRTAGLRPTRLERVYDGQYVLLDAVRDVTGAPPEILPEEESVEEVIEAAATFAASIEAARRRWRDELARAAQAGETTVIWGAGSKGVAFLTTLGLTGEIACAVDVDPDKQGLWMPVTGHAIVAPSRLTEMHVDRVIVMNPAYRDEITAGLRAAGSEAKVETL